MPSSIAMALDIVFKVDFHPSSAFFKYFKQPPSLAISQHDLASIQDVELPGLPFKSEEIGPSFQRRVEEVWRSPDLRLTALSIPRPVREEPKPPYSRTGDEHGEPRSIEP